MTQQSLHSTMSLLNHPLPNAPTPFRSSLHSTMSLLNHALFPLLNDIGLALHSTMSLLNLQSLIRQVFLD